MLYVILALVLLALLSRIAGAQGMGLTDVTANQAVKLFAVGVAHAEGYFVTNSISAVRNNPGNIKVNGVIYTYATPEDGWAALYAQLLRIFENRSDYYNNNMTIYEVAVVWTGGDNPEGWAQTIAQYVGAGPDTRIVELV